MLFTRDVELGLQAAVDLVNTLPGVDGDPDGLTTMSELDDWFDREGFTGERRHDAHELASMRALRHRLRALWEASDDDAAVELVNAMLADGRAAPQVVEHDGMGWHIHATRADAPLADRVMVEIAMDWVDVLRQLELGDGWTGACLLLGSEAGLPERLADGDLTLAGWESRVYLVE